MDEPLIAIGEIKAARGYSGELRVLPLSDHKERYHGLDRVYAQLPDGEVRSLRVKGIRWQNQLLLVTLEGITNPEQAAELRGALLSVPQSECWPLPEDNYYIFQIIGLKVYDEELGFLGLVEDVQKTPANDIYLVRGPEGQEFWLPALKEVVHTVDLTGSKLLVKLPPGLLD